MDFTQLYHPSLKEMFAEDLIKKILSGKLAIGEWLPKERELAKKMRVSRTVINDGIMHLARMGFLEVVPRKGAFVADYTMKGTMEAVKAVLDYNDGRFEPVLLNSAYEMRDNLNTYITRLAAERRTEQDVADLRAQLEKMESLTDPEALANETYFFYHLMARATANVLCPIQIYNKKFIYIALLRIIYRHVRKGPWLEKKQRLLDLIEEKNVDAAVKHVQEINRLSREIIKTHYASERTPFQTGEPAWKDGVREDT